MSAKSKTKAPAKPAIKPSRTTVTLAEVVWQMAHRRMESKGFNFSAYVAHLIRQDMEKENKRKIS